ncbi:MAG: hypothetical protein NT165_03910 [Candidatus Falkowbacteria bacterium]|nr:hypothetical protein [Candidatus Falkowbacteria bacterium]
MFLLPRPALAGWTSHTELGAQNWSSITSSADGMKMAASVSGGHVYTSVDGGNTWVERPNSGLRDWSAITYSADGSNLVAVVSGGYIYTSEDDGDTWVEHAAPGNQSWTAITSSANGVKLAATTYGGHIYTSIDSGTIWTEQLDSVSDNWVSITSSADGMKLAAVLSLGFVYTSVNGGATWTEQTDSGWNHWVSIASSADGTKITAVSNYIYTSADSGYSWVRQNEGYNIWKSVASSANGDKLVIVSDSNYVFTSNDGGITWSEQTESGFGSWLSVTSSADGAKIAGVISVGYLSVFTYSPPIPPTVTTGVATLLSVDSVILNGDIAASGGEHETTQGFDYGLTTEYGDQVENSGSFSIGSYTIKAFSLACETTYHYRAYAANSSGTGYGEDRTFTTGSCSLIYGEWITQTNSGVHDWYSITSSADGSKLAVITGGPANDGYIYTSNDGGLNWTTRVSAGLRHWRNISSSADGKKLAAVVYGGYIYTSIDGGDSWTEQTESGSLNWYSITSSADGSKLAAVVSQGYIYTSIDGGVHWTEQTESGSLNWVSITSSADGSKLAAVVYRGSVYTSIDGGVSWVERSSIGQYKWWSIASSADGNKLITANYDQGCIYTSTDGGLHWTIRTDLGAHYWVSVASSADGNNLVAAANNSDYIYSSRDGGENWLVHSGAGSRDWYSVSSSADGNKFAAGVLNGYVYTYSVVPILSTESSTEIYSNSAMVKGSITSTGAGNDQVRGFEYGPTNSYGNSVVEHGNFGTSTYTNALSSLDCETTYHYRSYATNGYGTGYGPDKTFTTGSCGIYLDGPAPYQIFQRRANNKADILISGTYTGSPTAIEASWNGGPYIVISHNVSHHTFGGVLTDQVIGQGSLIVRFSDNHLINAASPYVGIGDIYVIAGQSNADGLGQNIQSYSHPILRAGEFGNDDKWKNLIDPVDSAVNQVDNVSAVDRGMLGSIWPLLATKILDNTNIPVAFVPCSMGGTSIIDWQRNNNNPGDTSTLYGSMYRRINAVGKVKAVLFWQGEYDARNGSDKNTYKNLLNTFANDINNDFDAKTVVAQIGEYYGQLGSNLNNIRLAQEEAWDENQNILAGPSLYDINLSWDGVHVYSDSEVRTAANRWWAALEQDFYGGINGRGPRLVGLEEDSSRTVLILTMSASILPILPVTGIQGFEVRDDGSLANISSVARGSDNTIIITLQNALHGLATVSLGNGDSANGLLVPIDSGPYHLPAEIFINQGLFAPNHVPAASSVSISGNFQVGQQLAGTYVYIDNENGPERNSRFHWFRDQLLIDGETQSTYITKPEDWGHNIYFEVTPVAVSGNMFGFPTRSNAFFVGQRGSYIPFQGRIQAIKIVLPDKKEKSLTVSSSSTSLASTLSFFVKNLGLGSVDKEVKRLQEFLNLHGYPVAKSGAGSKGKESNSFGRATNSALVKFQKAKKINPASGYFGPITRKVVNALINP